MADNITDSEDELMYLDGYVGEEPDYYNDEYVGDSYVDTAVTTPKRASVMTQHPMAVKIAVNEAESFPTERYLFVADGYCVLNIESWPHVVVKNSTVSTMRMSVQDSLYYFPDSDDQQSYMNKQGIVVKKEDMLQAVQVPSARDIDDIPF